MREDEWLGYRQEPIPSQKSDFEGSGDCYAVERQGLAVVVWVHVHDCVGIQ